MSVLVVDTSTRLDASVQHTGTQPGEITRLLRDWDGGDPGARDRLMPLLFHDLRELARQQHEREKVDHTLQPTALVSELYLKLSLKRSIRCRNRQEFFGIAAKLIRRILVDHARKRQAAKRGDDKPKVSFDESLGLTVEDPILVALDDALKDLEQVDPRGSRVVELHAFGGLKFDEIAEVLGVARSTVLRDWKHARLWLRHHLRGTEPSSSVKLDSRKEDS